MKIIPSMHVHAAREKNSGLKDTDFGRAFLRFDGADPDEHFAAAYAALAMGMAGGASYIVRALYGDVQLKPLAFSIDQTEAAWERTLSEVAGIESNLRVRRGPHSVIVSMPVTRVQIPAFFYPDPKWAAFPPLQHTESALKTAIARIRASKLRDVFDPDIPLDVSVSAEEVLRATDAKAYARRTLDFDEVGYPKLFKRVFSNFRILRPSLAESLTVDQKKHGVGMGGIRIPFSEFSVDHPTVMNSPNVGAELLTLMLGLPFTVFIEAELDDHFVSSLTGTSAKEVPLSLVGSWLSSTMQFQWLGESEDGIGDVTQVNSLGIAKAESLASKALPYDPAANAERLCIDNDGFYYYIPETDQVEQYEHELETIFKDEKGEWTPFDTKNPRNLVRSADAKSRVRTVRRDSLVYTDFRAGVLAYTDSKGLLRTEDISSFRTVTATHLRELLDFPLDQENYDNADFVGMLNSALRSSLDIAGNIPDPYPATMHGHDANNPYNLEWFQRQSLNDQFKDFLNGKNGGDLVPYVARLGTLYSTLVTENEVSPGVWDSFIDPKFRNISPNSVFPELRIVHQLLSKYLESLKRNFEQASSDYTLLSTLRRIGFLSALIPNAFRYEEIVQADQVERAPYLTKPEDYRTVEIPEIPFARGVKLMPHQVKALASLKRFPKRAVLSVMAGGGKTFLAPLIALMYMKHVGVKRALVVCPNILLQNYFEDATYATSGALNVICVNSETIRRWGADKLGELIHKAPINTIVCASFDSMAKGNPRMYGSRKLSVNSVTEFLKQFDFDMSIIDESHRVKRMSSNTNRNVARLTSRCRYALVMTGTLIFNSTRDVIGQFNLLDSTIFGSDAHFDNKYMESQAGIKRAKAESPRQVKDRIAATTAYIQIDRKEWAALLPPRVDEFDGTPTEKFHILNDPSYPGEPQLTPAQSAYYNDVILKEVREKIIEDARTDEGLRKVLAAMANKNEDGEDEELVEGIMNKLNPYLARLEIFVANPVNSREAENTLKFSSPADKVSPKAKKVAQICRDHLRKGYVGKVLVFTQYNESAEGIYNALPPELKAKAVHYTAANKTTLKQFVDDPNVMFLIGNERSIGTGLNLQVASRIIRCESTWNWGALEQAESRVNRPVPKSKEIRKAIYLDWLVVSATIDVTKICRMISKSVESYKFINAGNPAFDDMPPLEAIKMSLENILLRNDVNDPEHDVMGHFEAFNLCRVLEEQEFQSFRADPNIRTEPYELTGGVLPGSGLLKNVPYVPGVALYGRDKLGLVPFIEYVTQVRKSSLEAINPTDLMIHTEDGDGTCTGFRRSAAGTLNSVTVELPNGEKGTYDLSSIFVITKPSVDVDTRRQVAEVVMTEHMGRPIKILPSKPVTVQRPKPLAEPAPEKPGLRLLRNKPVPSVKTKRDLKYSLYNMSVGHMYALTASGDDPDTPMDLLLESGFQAVKPYYYAEIRNPKMLSEWYAKAQKVMTFAPESAEQIEEIMELMTQHKPATFFQNVGPSVLRNFWRDQKQAPKANVFNGFVSIEDNGQGKNPKIYVVAFRHLNPQMKVLISKSKVPSLEWELISAEQAWFTAPTIKAVVAKLKEIHELAPVQNFNLLLKKFDTLRPTPAK